jgi:hypothetical protein
MDMAVQIRVPSARGTNAGAALFPSTPAKKNVRVLRHHAQEEILPASQAIAWKPIEQRAGRPGMKLW